MNKEIKERYKYIDIESIMPHDAPLAGVEIVCDATCDLRIGHLAVEMKSQDPLILANLAAKTVSGVHLSVPRGEITEGVVTLNCYYSGPGMAVVRSVVDVAARGQVKVVINHHKAEDSGVVINSMVLVRLAHDSVVDLVELAGSGATLLSTLVVQQQASSVVRMTTLDLDNRLLVRNQDVSLDEVGADCSLRGLYMTSDDQRCDNYIRVRHASENCTSNQHYKGVMGGKSVAAFTGSIFVDRDAQKTAAYQQNHNILLSDKARVYTRPQLEIYADDVKCNHGATVGKLDPEAVYYMRQRGISLDAARRLQVVGFAEDVVRLGAIGELQGLVESKIAHRLTQI